MTAEDPTPVWATWGPVRGYCGHMHRSVDTAERCRARDRAGCRRQGGYSDRDLVLEDPDCPGRAVWAADGSVAWPSHGRSCGSLEWPCRRRQECEAMAEREKR